MSVKTLRLATLPQPHKVWEIKNVAEGEVDVYVYGDIIFEEDRWWYGEDGPEVSAVSLRDELQAAGDVKRINLYVASLGGSFPQALAIYSELNRHPATKNGYVDGFAASAATVLLGACDEITVPANVMLHYHDVLAGCCGYFNAAEFRELADYCDRLQPMILTSYMAKRPTISEEELKELLALDMPITAQEAADIGLVDVVIDAVPLAARARDVLAAAPDVSEAVKAALAKGVDTRGDEEPKAEDVERELAESQRQAEEVAAIRARL